MQGWSHDADDHDDDDVCVLMVTKMLGFPLKNLIRKPFFNEIKQTHTLLF